MKYEKEFDVIIEQFNASSLSKSEWTHSAHLMVAFWHIKNYNFNDAICQLRSKIILLNHFHGTANNGHSGYHETLTIFWGKVIALYLKNNSTYSFEESVNHFLTSSLASKNYPFDFYKKEELLSPEYRAVYHEPSLHLKN